jgi:hypothetical protein
MERKKLMQKGVEKCTVFRDGWTKERRKKEEIMH